MTVRTQTVWRLRAVMLVVAAVLAVAPPAWGAIFSDINGLPAQRAIERLAARGIMRTGGDRFNPNGTVTRAEFAIFLSRALGISGQGLPAAEVKDWADVPRDAQPAVAAMTTMGSVSPQKVEVKKGVVTYVLATDKPVYGPTEMVELTFTITNTGKEDLKFEFANSQFYDFIIRDGQGGEVAKWSIGRAFLAITQPLTLAAGAKFDYKTRWRQLDQNDDPVDPGRYEVTAVLTTKSNPTAVSLIFNRGLMPVFSDNTFRPKLEVTRLELATTMAKGMGLPEGSPAALQGVPDAGDIPADQRGAVAAALEKRIVTLTADRAFRPSRGATRAEVAVALDGLMEAVKRYDFSKGTLKDIRVGTPTVIQIEDEQKALRTFRVARASAVYRNNGLADLKDLKLGDSLLFLKAGDVGDVAYIEATGR